MRRRTIVFLAAVVLAAVAWALLRARRDGPDAEPRLALATALAAAPDSGFARVTAPRTFRFPVDHGPHPEYRTEWWYFTGNVANGAGRRFGYQLTFFRSALAPEMPQRASRWAAAQVFMAHLAITDVEAGEMRACERFARAALGLAGAQSQPPRVWLEDWSADFTEAAARLRAAGCDVALDLRLDPAKPPVAHGAGGVSRKGPEAGNSSHYYSWTRARTTGALVVRGDTFRVRGSSWLDREWGTTQLSAGVAGWDWFGLQLSDGSELMLYRLRGAGGSATPFSAGTFVDPDGAVTRLEADDLDVVARGTWRSPRGGAYPSGWRVEVSRLALLLDVEPLLRDQELDLAVRYWEGAVRVNGRSAAGRVGGVGYVELTGYAGSEEPRAGG